MLRENATGIKAAMTLYFGKCQALVFRHNITQFKTTSNSNIVLRKQTFLLSTGYTNSLIRALTVKTVSYHVKKLRR